MDFQKLLKQAANNQATIQKKFEKKQQVVQDEKTHAKIHEAEKKKELKKKLKVFDEKTHKAKLIYKGLASKTGGSVTSTPTLSSNSNSSKAVPTSKSDGKNEIKHPHTLPTSKSEKSKDHSSRESKSKNISYTPHQNSSAQSKTPPSDSKTKNISKTRTPIPKKSAHSTPANFQQLMELAQKNSSNVQAVGAVTPGKSCTKVSGFSERNSVPTSIGIGRSLLRDSSRLDKSVSKPAMDSSSSGTTKQSQTANESNSKTKRVGVSDSSKHTTSVPCSSRNMDSINHSLQMKAKTPPPRLESSLVTKKSIRPSPYQISGHNEKCKSSKSIHPTGDMLRNKEGFKRGRNPNKFYTASAKLITDGSSSSARGPLLGYRSTWADEMSEYLHSNHDQLEEYESDEELDDFIDDGEYDEELRQDLDYSSAIKSIFGDRYLSAAPYEEDEVMESSFAQQQFEEVRSARIGQLEDEEELRKEKLEMKRKRKSKFDNNSLKKSKK